MNISGNAANTHPEPGRIKGVHGEMRGLAFAGGEM